MRLNQFEYLLAIKEYKTFSQAAQQLFVSQPSFSLAIKELENELGFTIVVRNKKGTKFTPMGELCVKEAEKIMKSVKVLERIKYDESLSFYKHFRVGCTSYFSESILLDILAGLQNENSELTLKLIEDDTDNILKNIYKDKLDGGLIIISYLNEKQRNSELNMIKAEYKILYNGEMKFVVKKDHPVCLNNIITLEDILEYPFVTRRKDPSYVAQKLLNDYNNMEISYISGENNLLKFLKLSDASSVFPDLVIRSNDAIIQEFEEVNIDNFKWMYELIWVYGENIDNENEAEFLKKMINRINVLAEKNK